MALLGNYYLLHKLPLKFSGGASIPGMRSNFNQADRARNIFLNASWSHKNGIPSGYIPPYCWTIPASLPDPKGLSKTATIAGTGAIVAPLTGKGWLTITIPGAGAFTSDISGLSFISATTGIQGIGSVIAPLEAIAQLDSSLSGSGTISTAGLAGAIWVAATLAGIGAIPSASLSGLGILDAVIAGLGDIFSADMAGGFNAIASIAGIGSVVAPLEAIGWIDITISGIGTVTAPITAKGWLDCITAGIGLIVNANLVGGMNISSAITGMSSLTALLDALGWIGAEINIGFQPSAFDIAQSVWNALAVQYNLPATMGAKLNAAGGAADPWATPLPGTYLPGTAGKIIGDAIIAEVADLITRIKGLDAIYDSVQLRGLEVTLTEIKELIANIDPGGDIHSGGGSIIL